MAEKDQERPIPSAAPNGHVRSAHMEAGATTGTAAHDARELRKKKRQKCFLYIILFIIFQSAIIAIFTLTIMKIRTPKFRVRSAMIENFTTNPSTSSNTRLNVEFGIKNANFGRYKYENTIVYFFYKGTPAGEIVVPKSHAKWRSTKKFNGFLDLNLGNVERNSAAVTLTSQATLKGKVELLFVMKKKKSINLNCSMDIFNATQQLQNIVCK